MLSKILTVCAALLTVLVLAEAAALLVMYTSVSRYAAYWRERAAGLDGSDGPITYVALGDSAAQGIGASRPDKGYVGLLADDIATLTGRQVRVVNLSVTGATLADVLQHQLPQVDRYRPDIITVEVGGNDVRSYQPEPFERDFGQLLDGLPAGRTVVATVPYFGGRIRSDGNDAVMSDVIRRLAAARGISVADLYTDLRSRHTVRLYAADWFHPSDHGYRVWRDSFRPVVTDRLRER